MDNENNNYDQLAGEKFIKEEFKRMFSETASEEQQYKSIEETKQKAEELAKLQKNFQEQNAQILNTASEVVGDGNLRTFNKMFDIDPLLVSRAINAIKDDYSKEDIQEYFDHLNKEKDFKRFDQSKYNNALGNEKLTKDIDKDIEKYFKKKNEESEKQKALEVETQKAQEQSKENTQILEEEDNEPKFRKNLQPESMNSDDYGIGDPFNEDNREWRLTALKKATEEQLKKYKRNS